MRGVSVHVSGSGRLIRFRPTLPHPFSFCLPFSSKTIGDKILSESLTFLSLRNGRRICGGRFVWKTGKTFSCEQARQHACASRPPDRPTVWERSPRFVRSARSCGFLQESFEPGSFVLRLTGASRPGATAAMVRGVPLSTGAKALICKLDDCFAMFVMPADRKLDGKRVRQALGARSLRFATPDELRKVTGLAPGAVPPFGRLFGLRTHCDVHLGESEQINFNAGDHSISICMLYGDYLAVERPEIGEFAE